MSTLHFHTYENFDALAQAALKEWLGLIEQANTQQRTSQFALAGGTTPSPIYRLLDHALASRPALFAPIKLIATDERWVADKDPQSNEGLFQQSMAQSFQQQWQLVSLKNEVSTPKQAVGAIDHRLRAQIPAAFDAVLLGMGTDGHVASLFPGGATQLGEAWCVPALHPQNQQHRMSLSLPRLVDAGRIWLVITGAEKRRVLENALETNLPIAALIQAARCPIDVFWCP